MKIKLFWKYIFVVIELNIFIFFPFYRSRTKASLNVFLHRYTFAPFSCRKCVVLNSSRTIRLLPRCLVPFQWPVIYVIMPLDSIYFWSQIAMGDYFFFFRFSSCNRRYTFRWWGMAAHERNTPKSVLFNSDYCTNWIRLYLARFSPTLSSHPSTRDWNERAKKKKKKTKKTKRRGKKRIKKIVCVLLSLSLAILLCRPSSVWSIQMVVFACVLNAEITHSIVVICGDVIKCQKCKFCVFRLIGCTLSGPG